MAGKFKVNPEYRVSELSRIPSNTVVEAHMNSGSIKVYDNVHYPERFARAIFNREDGCLKVVVKKGDELYEIEKPTN